MGTAPWLCLARSLCSGHRAVNRNNTRKSNIRHSYQLSSSSSSALCLWTYRGKCFSADSLSLHVSILSLTLLSSLVRSPLEAHRDWVTALCCSRLDRT